MRIDHSSILKDAQPAPVEFAAMIADLLATQAGSPAAAAQIHHDVMCRIAHSHEEALTTLIQAQPGWRAAAAVLEGSFHSGVAKLVRDNCL